MPRNACVDPLEVRRLLAVIYVDENAPNSGRDGESWAHAFPTLTEGLNAAQSGDDIYLADGTYIPDLYDRSISFEMKSGVDLFGGYAGRGASNPDKRNRSLYPTILSGDIGESTHYDNTISIVKVEDLAAPILLDGITVADGHGSSGAGVSIRNSSVTLRRMTFTENDSHSSGAVYFNSFENDNSLLIDNCDFRLNTGYGAGAIGIRGYTTASVVIRDSRFDKNSSSHNGCAITVYDAGTQTKTSVLIDGCTFREQKRGSGGSADADISVVDSSINTVIKDSTFLENLATPVKISNGKVVNCTFRRNSDDDVSGVKLESSEIFGSVFENNKKRTVVTMETGSAVYGCTFVRNLSRSIHAQGGSIENCIFSGNHAVGTVATSGGHGATTLLNSIFVGNRSESAPGALFLGSNYSTPGEAIILNCTFVDNEADDWSTGTAIYSQGEGSAIVRNSIFWGKSEEDDEVLIRGYSISVSDSIVEGGYQSGTNIIALNPKFVRNPDEGEDERWGGSDDDYGDLRLRADSPAINAGATSAVKNLTTQDLDNAPRLAGAAVDLGAYEFGSVRFASLDSGLLSLNGTSASDTLSATRDDTFVTASLNSKSVKFLRYDVRQVKVIAGAGDDVISIDPDAPTANISGGDGADTIHAGAGHDTISGGAQRDLLYGGKGNDRINGNGGDDQLFGEDGDDFLRGDEDDDKISGGLGADRLYGGSGNDTLGGGKSNDRLYGDTGNDRLDGNERDDLIDGGSGSDRAVNDESDSLVKSIETLL